MDSSSSSSLVELSIAENTYDILNNNNEEQLDIVRGRDFYS